ncbi:MAG: polysaccharide deacetylase family protein [Pseudomonadota bacterium]
MRNLKPVIIRVLGSAGGYRMSRWLTKSVPKILMYHRFSAEPTYGHVNRDMFERQVNYLQSRFNLFSLRGLIEAYQSQGAFPANAAVITVDDGYSDFYEIAYPVLRKYGAPATFFITTRFVAGGFWLWPDLLRFILHQSRSVNMNELPGGMNFQTDALTSESRDYLWGMIVIYLLAITEEDKKSWIERFAAVQGVVVADRPLHGYRAVSWNQVREMSRHKIEIGAHSRTHPSLGKIGKTQLQDEVQGSVDDITGVLGHPPASFCYPNGQPSDYTDEVKVCVKNAGCSVAVTAFYDDSFTDDLYELRRFNASEYWPDFLKTVNGVDALSARWLKSNSIMNQVA